ncbi:MAG: hypothetical protein L0215_18385 [Gemmataceae bacterium]|nr:hypothetical protein [Gemmataceae bacterium]
MAGLTGIRTWKAVNPELVQPRQLPDGLVEVQLEGRAANDLFLLEIYTYPDSRIPGELADDLMLTYIDRRRLPEVLTLILHPKGNLQAPPSHRVASPLGWSGLAFSWQVVELWKVPVGPLLAAKDPGLVPWLLLTQLDREPSAVLHDARDILGNAMPSELESLQIATQILGRLRYNDEGLFAILGGKKAMIESPVFKEIIAETRQKDILSILRGKFEKVSSTVEDKVKTIQDDARLDDLLFQAATSSSLEEFEQKLD